MRRRRRRRTALVVGMSGALVACAFAAVALARPFVGTRGDDVINATDHHDIILGRAGNDTLNGGPGNDIFHVRDGEADHVTCGEGYDQVRADYKDVVANDCELVVRRRARERSRAENED